MLKRRLLPIDKPHVLILHEHHATRYLLVKNDDDLYRLALEILDWRFGGKKNNYGYYVLEKPEEPSTKDIVFDAQTIEELPSEGLREFARKQRKIYEANMASYRRAKEQYDAVHEALLSKDSKRAWRILQAMSSDGGDDDVIELTPLETAYYLE